MADRVRVIIIQNQKLLLIKRQKAGETYFVLPGGGVEAGESDSEALERECLEEASVKIVVGDLAYRQKFNGNEERFYFCRTKSGTVRRGNGPERLRESADNRYELVWMDLGELKDLNIKPVEILKIIV